MNFNFSESIDRSGWASVKYDLRASMFGRPDVLPMWVADMDLATPSFVMEALANRLKHPILGYTIRNQSFLDAIVWWQKKRFDWQIDSSWVGHCPGIVAGLNHAIQALTHEGDKILIQTPVYHPFFSAVQLNKRQLVTNPLLLRNNRYEIDFEHFAHQIANGVKLFVLCNPHNPVGRVWAEEELRAMASICLEHGVTIISDEIHADLILKPHRHIPIASLSHAIEANTVTFNAPSKSFNIAGLATAYVIIRNAQWLEKYNQQLEINGTSTGNLMGYTALVAAYSEQGEHWLNALMSHIDQNLRYVETFLQLEIPQIGLPKPEGTFLIWLDFRKFHLSQEELNSKLINRALLGLNDGAMFGKDGTGFQRMNIGCPLAMVQEAMHRLKTTFT